MHAIAGAEDRAEPLNLSADSMQRHVHGPCYFLVLQAIQQACGDCGTAAVQANGEVVDLNHAFILAARSCTDASALPCCARSAASTRSR